MRANSVFHAVAGCIMFSLIVGCGGREMPAGTTGTVKGRITIEGEPAPEGTVVLMTHTTGGHAATGTVKADGYFSMRFRDGTQLLTGIYNVGVSPAGRGAAGGEIDVNSPEYQKIMMSGGNAEAEKPPFAERYLTPGSSGEECEVAEGQNEYNLDLKK